MEIKDYQFRDTDISLVKASDYSIEIKVEYKCHVTKPNEYAYAWISKECVRNLARHFKLTAEDLV